jgi:leucyl/phenylalanyl-tRNA--protein transferase
VKRRTQGPYLLGEGLEFPPVHLADEHGLLAIGGDLSVERLLAAYRGGIFPWPWYDGMPMFWWAPDPRFVVYPGELHVGRSLKTRINTAGYEIRYDTAFERVIRGCAQAPRPGQDGTWITAELIEGFVALHRAGYAHSAEAWEAGQLVGGLYGVAIGDLFCGESMFTTRPDASKVAFVHMVRMLAARGYRIIDCQLETEHLARFGAREIPRARYMQELASCLETEDRVGDWRNDG